MDSSSPAEWLADTDHSGALTPIRLGEEESIPLLTVDWFNQRRLLEPIGNIPPAEFEALYDERIQGLTTGAGLN